jgi:nitrilase
VDEPPPEIASNVGMIDDAGGNEWMGDLQKHRRSAPQKRDEWRVAESPDHAFRCEVAIPALQSLRMGSRVRVSSAAPTLSHTDSMHKACTRPPARAYPVAMERPVTVACVQAEPVILDRSGTLDRLEELASEAARNGAELIVFPETFVPVYPSSRWAKAFAGWQSDGAKATFARIAQNSIAVGSPEERRLGAAAKELGVWLVTGVNEVEPERPGTIYNSLLYHSPDGELALHHRKLVPTNHERLIWGQGDGRGLHAVETGFGRVGGLICWENYMPLARVALYEAGVEIYIAPTADDSDQWQATLVHIARESRAYVVAPCHFQRAPSYPSDFALASELQGVEGMGRGGSAILAPNGSYLAGPLYEEEGILYAELDPALLLAERQRFDPVGHYSRPDVLQLSVNPSARAADVRPSTRLSSRSDRS